MSILEVNVIYRIWEFGPLDDISIRVLHRNHPMQLEEGEYIFTVRIGTTLKEVKQKLFDVKLREFRWLDDELMLWEKMRPCVELTDKDDFEDDTTLYLNLVNKHYCREESEEDRVEEESAEESEEEESD